MPKIKLTKSELKQQRDALKQYKRYLPTLQLKKQQLQMEILKENRLVSQKKEEAQNKLESAKRWAGLLNNKDIDMKGQLEVEDIKKDTNNVAGVDLPVFREVIFKKKEYSLFYTPLWLDKGALELKGLLSARIELGIIEEGVKILKEELRITAQRVNLFEKVKIPASEDAIRRIKIYLGDQMTNAVGRSKIAKRKIEAAFREEVTV